MGSGGLFLKTQVPDTVERRKVSSLILSVIENYSSDNLIIFINFKRGARVTPKEPYIALIIFATPIYRSGV